MMIKTNSPFLWILLACVSCCCLVERIHAWTTRLLSSRHDRLFVGRRGRRPDGLLVLTAKPPPAAQFDFDAIEAFEAQLDQAAQIAADGDDDDDDDDLSSGAFFQNKQQQVRELTIDDALDGKRIDAALATAFSDLSRSACGSLVSNQQVYLLSDNDNSSSKHVLDRKSFKVQVGQVLQVHLASQESEITEIVAQDIPLDVLYEDEHMIVLNKAAHMVVHPASGNWDGTVVNALAYYLKHKSPYGQGELLDTSLSQDVAVEGTDGESVNFRPGIVHRLDKGTTGVLVVAKTTQALAQLSAAFAQRQVKKTYLAITVGNPGRRVVIDKPIGRHPIHRQRMRVVPNPHKHGLLPESALAAMPSSSSGRRALSFVDTLAFDGRLSLVKVRIETGRTHQIRVHLADRRTPIYGDDVYGLADWNKKLKQQHGVERPLLHAYRLEINHPVTGQPMVFEAPLSADMWRLGRAIYPPAPDHSDYPPFLKQSSSSSSAAS